MEVQLEDHVIPPPRHASRSLCLDVGALRRIIEEAHVQRHGRRAFLNLYEDPVNFDPVVSPTELLQELYDALVRTPEIAEEHTSFLIDASSVSRTVVSRDIVRYGHHVVKFHAPDRTFNVKTVMVSDYHHLLELGQSATYVSKQQLVRGPDCPDTIHLVGAEQLYTVLGFARAENLATPLFTLMRLRLERNRVLKGLAGSSPTANLHRHLMAPLVLAERRAIEELAVKKELAASLTKVFDRLDHHLAVQQAALDSAARLRVESLADVNASPNNDAGNDANNDSDSSDSSDSSDDNDKEDDNPDNDDNDNDDEASNNN
ncbi:hypothetical protein SDRG_16543 [Saprolegnia diclina VS20]|uniref:Uncharacterized protein n=1 Tax=Saprolegnia diclina (strain VS20) TaxID=1156394 RepID=T0R0S3_SAPDV|nr:hypothetical protein SDRG_16543 [Saprolegnia diclina VS20]EQC25573.1 hypothetical protein SDRG_16543 [Saprolegnia diclina VS20]|eukprot:XP_008620980.1 hypothetical protein SDRG_16543 [Saprolegnia diclina VS20]